MLAIKDTTLSQDDTDDSMVADDSIVADDSMVADDESEDGMSEENTDSDSGEDVVGNASWADAMSRVLNTNVSKEKKFILSKAKKDTDIVKKVEQKSEVELVDESGNVKKTEKITQVKSFQEKRKEMLQKQKQKAAWESMCRVKPDITDRPKEIELVRIATRGVVHLFNTVEKHQKKNKNPKEKNPKKKETIGAVKGSFMDMLKGQSKTRPSTENEPEAKKVKQEETWSILKDDFMMGAEMKDWDKDSDND